MISGRQIREARALLKWGQWRVARRADMSMKMLAAIESDDGVPDVGARRMTAIQRTFETAGVEFILEDGGGAGVRLRRSNEP